MKTKGETAFHNAQQQLQQQQMQQLQMIHAVAQEGERSAFMAQFKSTRSFPQRKSTAT